MSNFYTLFYYRFVEGNRSRDEQYWLHHYTDRSVESWEGFTFEEVCLRHLPQIKRGLGISGMATEASSWRYVPGKGVDGKGAQIDLVIKRSDKIIHLVEMKFAESKYSITKDYANRLQERKALFMEQTKIMRGAVLTFVTPSGIAQNSNSGIVHSKITSKDLFAEE